MEQPIFGDADETKEGEELNESQEEEEVALPVDPEDCILDFTDGDEIPSEVDTRLPKYNWQRAVGPGLISKLECYECSVCSKFFDTEVTAEIHSRTATHHRNFLKFINEKSSDTKIAQKRAAAALEENERKKRKIEETEAPSTEGAAEEATEGAEGELYDPSEATGDDDDVEMADDNAEGEGEGEGEEEVEGEGEEDGAGQDNGEEEMEAQEEEQEAEQEPEPEPSPAKTPAAAEPAPVTKTPAKTPAKAAAATPAAAATTPDASPSPAKKATPARAAAGPKATPQRQRARGRYNRY